MPVPAERKRSAEDGAQVAGAPPAGDAPPLSKYAAVLARALPDQAIPGGTDERNAWAVAVERAVRAKHAGAGGGGDVSSLEQAVKMDVRTLSFNLKKNGVHLVQSYTPVELVGLSSDELAEGMARRGLQDVSVELRADRGWVLAAVAQDGYALQRASVELRADRVVVLAAVAQDGSALRWAPAELKADRVVVLAAVAQCGHALRHASDELKVDREVVLATVAKHGAELWRASAELRADRDVVLAAVAQCGNALSSASAELKADRDVVLAAVAQSGHAQLSARLPWQSLPWSAKSRKMGAPESGSRTVPVLVHQELKYPKLKLKHVPQIIERRKAAVHHGAAPRHPMSLVALPYNPRSEWQVADVVRPRHLKLQRDLQ